MPSELRVLFITTEPDDLPRPPYTRELEAILQEMKNGGAPFRAENAFHATRRRVMEALEQSRPEVVHFLCHGNPEGLMIEDDDRVATLVSEAWLLDVFSACPTVRLVVLNACKSAGLARALATSPHTPILGAFGWPDLVTAENARKFVSPFYNRLARNHSTRSAFEFARRTMEERDSEPAELQLRTGEDFHLRGEPEALPIADRDPRAPAPNKRRILGYLGGVAVLTAAGMGLWLLDVLPGSPQLPDDTTTPTTPTTMNPDIRIDLGNFNYRSGDFSPGQKATIYREVQQEVVDMFDSATSCIDAAGAPKKVARCAGTTHEWAALTIGLRFNDGGVVAEVVGAACAKDLLNKKFPVSARYPGHWTITPEFRRKLIDEATGEACLSAPPPPKLPIIKLPAPRLRAGAVTHKNGDLTASQIAAAIEEFRASADLRRLIDEVRPCMNTEPKVHPGCPTETYEWENLSVTVVVDGRGEMSEVHGTCANGHLYGQKFPLGGKYPGYWSFYVEYPRQLVKANPERVCNPPAPGKP
jgi:hypothetical protein